MPDHTDARRRLLLGGGLAALATGGLAAGRADAVPASTAWACGGNTGIAASTTSARGTSPHSCSRPRPPTTRRSSGCGSRRRGRAGIGITTPSSPLHVQATGGTALSARLTNRSYDNVAVHGTAVRGVGVRGESTDEFRGAGVEGVGVTGLRARGRITGLQADGDTYGINSNGGTVGVIGTGSDAGVLGRTTSSTGDGVEGRAAAPGAAGVFGVNSGGAGVWGRNENGSGSDVFGEGLRGVFGLASGSTTAQGVRGEDGAGGSSGTRLAGFFLGKVQVAGTLVKSAGTFKIDHPLDPTGKYLSHSFVESPDMKNIYDGVATLGADGTAEVELPAYFEALNTDFRYQLTCLGGFADVYVAREIDGNRFTIAGGTAGLRVSWQVTGIRKDAYARKHPVVVEEEKPAAERGRYLHPDAFGKALDEGETMTRSQA